MRTYILRRIIGAPADKGDLVARAFTRLQLVLDIEDGIATADALLSASVLALCVQELVAECVVVGVFGRLLNDNLFPVVADLVDDPFDVLAELELVERADALGGYGDTAMRWLAAKSFSGGAVRAECERLELDTTAACMHVRTRIEPAGY